MIPLCPGAAKRSWLLRRKEQRKVRKKNPKERKETPCMRHTSTNTGSARRHSSPPQFHTLWRVLDITCAARPE